MVMTTMQINAELFQSLGVIAEDEGFMRRAAKYVKKLAEQKRREDETLMTKEAFLARVDESLEQARRGEGRRFDNKEDMNAWLNSL